jgi:hypothetical protein
MSFWGAVTLRKRLQHMLLHPGLAGRHCGASSIIAIRKSHFDPSTIRAILIAHLRVDPTSAACRLLSSFSTLTAPLQLTP